MIKDIRPLIAVLLIGVTVTSLWSCTKKDNTITFNRDVVKVRRVHVGDSVSSVFRFHNNTEEKQTVSFIPDCDCTTISPKSINLSPHERGELMVKINVDSAGEFIKYVYAQVEGSDAFIVLKVKGSGK